MTFVESLHTYGLKEKRLTGIIKKINKGKKISNLFLVVLPINKREILEIYPYNQLLQKGYDMYRDEIKVLGVSRSREDAFRIVEDIVQYLTDNGIRWESAEEINSSICDFYNLT